jgi:hypothetical protein
MTRRDYREAVLIQPIHAHQWVSFNVGPPAGVRHPLQGHREPKHQLGWVSNLTMRMSCVGSRP